MSDVFLSYARADGKRCADFLLRILEDEGWSVFRDRERIRAGEGFPERIRRELDSAGCVVVLWSEGALNSEWVRREAHAAHQMRKLVPLSIDGVDQPRRYASIHIHSLAGWQDIEDIDVETESDEDLEALAAAIRAMLGEDDLRELLYSYLVHVCSDRIRWCVPSRIREDAALYLRFEPIADARLDQIRDALDELAEEGWVLYEDGRYAFR